MLMMMMKTEWISKVTDESFDCGAVADEDTRASRASWKVAGALIS